MSDRFVLSPRRASLQAMLFVATLSCHSKRATPSANWVGTWTGGRSVLGERVELVIEPDGRARYHRTSPDSSVSQEGIFDGDHGDVIVREGLGEHRMHVTAPTANDAGSRLDLDGLELVRR